MRLLLLLVLIAVALIAQAPAWLVAQPVRDSTNGIVELRRAAGTVWRGEADVVLKAPAAAARDTSAREANAGRVQWSARRFDLERSAAIIDIAQTPPASRPLTITALAADRGQATGMLRLPVEALALVPLLAQWKATGEAIADIADLAWEGRSARGNGVLKWRGARLLPPNLPGGIALGDVEANVVLSGNAASVRARNTGGDVELAIDASSQTRSIAVTIQPRATATSAQLAWLKSHTMSRTPSGGFRIDAGWP